MLGVPPKITTTAAFLCLLLWILSVTVTEAISLDIGHILRHQSLLLHIIEG